MTLLEDSRWATHEAPLEIFLGAVLCKIPHEKEYMCTYAASGGLVRTQKR